MKLLVLGASGGCGQWLVRLADERGHYVRALVRPSTRPTLHHLDQMWRCYGDVRDASTLDWMAVRPTTFRDAPHRQGPSFRLYGLLIRISRGDVAAWMLNAVEQPTPFTRRTPMIGG